LGLAEVFPAGASASGTWCHSPTVNGVGVNVGVAVAVKVSVTVKVRVLVGVNVGDCAVFVGVTVRVMVFVTVIVIVPVAVGVPVMDAVLVLVTVGVKVTVGTGVTSVMSSTYQPRKALSTASMVSNVNLNMTFCPAYAARLTLTVYHTFSLPYRFCRRFHEVPPLVEIYTLRVSYIVEFSVCSQLKKLKVEPAGKLLKTGLVMLPVFGTAPVS
jgi:hypothetical protein